jgi:APA family basic amino acid/polyamine antiporter
MLRRLNTVDLTLITIGAVIGSGIFRNPAVVAAQAHLPWLILGCWIGGGIVALIGAFIFAELAARRPLSGGMYAYLRDAYHPAVAFTFGWTALWIADTGGTAASASLFSGYFAGYLQPLIGLHLQPNFIAVAVLAIITIINCFGVRQGATWQHIFVVLKVVAIGGLIVGGFLAHPASAAAATPLPGFDSPMTLVGALGLALLPVFFAYNGFQQATYMTAESKDAASMMPRGLIMGVSIIAIIYTLVNIGCLRVLGTTGLAASKTPAADVMQAFLGNTGAELIAAAIALSTLGFMSTRMLMAPRMYFQMSADKTLPKFVSWIHPKSHVPVFAIALQGTVAAILAATGTFAQIVNWTTIPEWFFLMVAACALFVFRKRDADKPQPNFRVPGGLFGASIFIAVVAGVLIAEALLKPLDMLPGIGAMATGLIFYFVWRRFATTTNTAS